MSEPAETSLTHDDFDRKLLGLFQQRQDGLVMQRLFGGKAIVAAGSVY